MREPLHHWDAPADVAGMHPDVGPWHREGIWRRARKRGSFEAIYSRSDTADQRRAVVDRAMIQRPEVIQWAIENGDQIGKQQFPRTTRTGRRKRRRA